MSLDQRIQSWLQQIEPASKDKHSAKRRRLNPPTPEPSRSGHSMGSSRSTKRRANDAHDDMEDTFETPRPLKLKAPRSESGTSLPSSSAASSKSGYYSPTKQLRNLEFHPRGVDPRELKDFHNKPASLKTLLQKIDHSSSGFGILPLSQRALMDELDDEIYNDFEWARQPPFRDIYFSNDRDNLGHTPPPEIIQTILHEAGECNKRGCSEAHWNVEVHHLVLKAAVRPLQGPRSNQFFDFLLSTTASILPEYQATSASKKVDFCMYTDPRFGGSSQISETILALRNVLPMGIFNHANLAPLSDRPIAVSIETKKTGEGWENARLQMEVWMAAHWQFLRKLLELRRLAAEAVSSLKQTTEGVTLDPEEKCKLPEFLPGIIIQGHDWHLVITTPDGEKTLFWQKKNFGQTSESKGIYTIIYNLQLLRRWAQEEYWKWMRELLLGWPRHKGEVFVVGAY
ncbi:hypothetical protein NOF04DRAFT_20549 [Fusarium oxysporum II5]|uniref:PD-(D/E)XK nuclease-like domain-containing protein n=4 Tax=Fusarium oxysporum species complex TaxID=171631 RepID=N1S5W1_FUSC4|nr:uncharacterized protein FOIG_16242 [Fusarium odoratissimum NRRL 54006]EMT73499.1 hypothetical protein FOC4_g10000531 [Fusarium odoratissimum]ENH66356.1 hypothetical protein FOC1_g10001639 [Fusarium oxysporum f. sp. cubense race 1]KAK2134130.1 hypothetical protein NOF04DRAFT_20549 [Fusarium oxysporum II5]TVY73977.1 hypothetical protein Focb16_v005443 [Fusarium oxysporum f. sp. cubense]EXL90521.1 hypothetical protein FOIG_16242 [Fusarium odoratissimum NRRL 54006]